MERFMTKMQFAARKNSNGGGMENYLLIGIIILSLITLSLLIYHQFMKKGKKENYDDIIGLSDNFYTLLPDWLRNITKNLLDKRNSDINGWSTRIGMSPFPKEFLQNIRNWINTLPSDNKRGMEILFSPYEMGGILSKDLGIVPK